MRHYRIASIPGDGIGPEGIAAGLEALRALEQRCGDFRLAVEAFDWGSDHYKRHGVLMPADGLAAIKDFFARFGQEDAYQHSNEVKVLKKFAREIRRKLPVDPMQKLQTQLERAVKREAYEEAARLRDEIKRKTEKAE